MTPDPRPPRRIKDPDALRTFRLTMMNEPCEVCELRPGTDAHHVTFRSQGGDDTPDNLVWLRPPLSLLPRRNPPSRTTSSRSARSD